MPRRKLSARLRENAITLLCRVLRLVFAALDLVQSSESRVQGPGSKTLSTPSSIVNRQSSIVNPAARVAIIKPCCLGDVVLATPVIRALNEARLDLELEFVVSDWARPVLENNHRLRALVATGFQGSSFTLGQYFRLVKTLRKRKYSAALVLDRSPLLALLPWLAGIKIRAGLDSRGRGFALNIRARLEAGDPIRHEAEIYLDVVRALGFEISNPKSEFYPGEAARSSFEQKATELGVDLARPLAVIHPGGGHNPDTIVLSKRWPAENFGEIAGRLLEKNVQVVLIGAQSDRELVETVRQTAGANPLLFEAAERFDIAEIGALYERAGLFVGNDTGLMHLAVACGAPTVAVFGPSSPVAYRPFTDKGRAVSPLKQLAPEGLPLSEYQALSAAEGGVAAVTVEQVWQAIEQFLPVGTRTQVTAGQEVEAER